MHKIAKKLHVKSNNMETVNCIYTVLLVKHSVEKKKRTLTSLKFEKKLFPYLPTHFQNGE